MRIHDIISAQISLNEQPGDPTQSVIDILTTMSGEGIDSISFNAIMSELSSEGYDIDDGSLFDLLDKLAIVRNIKDKVVFFNSDSDQSHSDYDKPDPEKDNKVVSKMAQKQVKKELSK